MAWVLGDFSVPCLLFFACPTLSATLAGIDGVDGKASSVSGATKWTIVLRMGYHETHSGVTSIFWVLSLFFNIQSNIYLLIFSFTFLATLTSADVVFGKASKESGTAKPTVMPSMGHPNNKVVCLIGYLFSSRLTSPVFCMCDLLHDECSCAGEVSGVFPSYMVKHAYYFDWLALYIYCIHLKDDGMI